MRVVKYLLIILIPPLIILGNFRYLMFNGNFYQKIYEMVGVYQSFEERVIVDAATNNLLGYFKGKNKLDFEFYSPQAKLHLADVKQILNFAFSLFYLLVVAVSLMSFVMLAKRSAKDLASAFLISPILTVVAILLLALGMLSAFDAFFLKFHQVIFTNNLWQFAPDDNLIKLFPQEFFIAFANRLAVNIAVTSGAIALASAAILKRVSR